MGRQASRSNGSTDAQGVTAGVVMNILGALAYQREDEPLHEGFSIWRVLKRHGLVTPQPHMRPRSSFIRFEAKLPNEDVVHVFHSAVDEFGLPASLLSDKAAVFTARSRRDKVELERLGVQVKHSTPYHPQACGKSRTSPPDPQAVLAKQPPATSIAELQL